MFLNFTGRQRGRYTEVDLDGRLIDLTSTSHNLLLKLAVSGTWVHKYDLGAKDYYGWKNITRLTQELGCVVHENDGHGHYRMGDVVYGFVVDELVRHSDPVVVRLVMELA